MSDLFGFTHPTQSSLAFPTPLTKRYRPHSIWDSEAPTNSPAPNFARLVKDSNNNVRAALMALETELLIAC